LTTDDLFPGSLITDNKTALAGAKVLSYLVGTWNFVNKTTSGTITFVGNTNHDFIQIVNGKILHGGGLDNSGALYSNGHLLELSYDRGQDFG